MLTMHKETVTKEDGRLLIFFNFDGEETEGEEPKTAGDKPADAPKDNPEGGA